MKYLTMDKQKIALKALVVSGMSLVMFVLLLLTSNKIYVLDQMVPFEIMYTDEQMFMRSYVLNYACFEHLTIKNF